MSRFNKYNFASMQIGEMITRSGNDGAKLLRAARGFGEYHFDWRYHVTRAKDGTGTITITRIEHVNITPIDETTRDKSSDDPGLVWEATEEHWQEWQRRVADQPDATHRTRDDYMTMVVGDAKTPAITNAEWTTGLAAIPRMLRPLPVEARTDWEGQRIPHWTETVGIASQPREGTGQPDELDAPQAGPMPTSLPGASTEAASTMPASGIDARNDGAAERAKLGTLPIDEPGISDEEFKLRLDARTIDQTTGKLLPNKMGYSANTMPVWDIVDTDD